MSFSTVGPTLIHYCLPICGFPNSHDPMQVQLHWGNLQVVLLLLCNVQLCVREDFTEKRTKRGLKKQKKYPHRCLMSSISDGLVICLWLFFMLHLPLFGCLKIPCSLYWFAGHDVKRRTELAGIVSGSKC